MEADKLKQEIAAIKHDFYAFRNGIVADALRRAGDPHQFIMGCQLVDVLSIARQHERDAQLAEALWADTKSRESRMIAPMLYPVGEFTPATAVQWAQSVENNEIADLLCHRLLRHLDFAPQLVRDLLGYETAQVRYVAFRLMLNLLIAGKMQPTGTLKTLVEAEIDDNTTPAMHQLLISLSEEF